MLKKRYTIAVATAALALALAGCTGGGTTSPTNSTSQSTAPTQPASDQSKADACALVQESLTDLAELNAEMDVTDPQKIIDSFKELSANATESLGSITNTEVKPAATKAAAALSDYVTFLEAVIADPTKATDMGDKVTALQEGFTEVGTVCAS